MEVVAEQENIARERGGEATGLAIALRAGDVVADDPPAAGAVATDVERRGKAAQAEAGDHDIGGGDAGVGYANSVGQRRRAERRRGAGIGDDRLRQIRLTSRFDRERGVKGVLTRLDDAVADIDGAAGADRLFGVGDRRPRLRQRTGIAVAAAWVDEEDPSRPNGEQRRLARLTTHGDHDRTGDDARPRLDDDPVERARRGVFAPGDVPRHLDAAEGHRRAAARGAEALAVKGDKEPEILLATRHRPGLQVGEKDTRRQGDGQQRRGREQGQERQGDVESGNRLGAHGSQGCSPILKERLPRKTSLDVGRTSLPARTPLVLRRAALVSL